MATYRHGKDRPRPDSVGVLALEVYFPTQHVLMSDMELADGCPGKYTRGLEQEAMSFCSDREDVVSMALTVAKSLMDKYRVRPAEVGHLQVATESAVDRSKSIKSHLMTLWRRAVGGGPPAEGVDCVHACYGGTAALLAAVDWVESRRWDGRLALVVAADVALYAPGTPARPTGGCGAAAILVGPDAPLVLDPLWYGSHAEHSWDFYKPLGTLPYPAVDGPRTLVQYLRAMGMCGMRLLDRVQRAGELAPEEGVHHFVAHAPFSKLARKGLARLALMDAICRAAAGLSSYESYATWRLEDKELEAQLVAGTTLEWREKAEDGSWLQKQVGNSYTASVWQGLASLVWRQGAQLAGRRLLLFSFGSGTIASLFSLVCGPSDPRFTLESIQGVLDLGERLRARVRRPLEVFDAVSAQVVASYACPVPYEPRGDVADVAAGSYYLLRVDEHSRRWYGRKV
ncbi:hypothetical protein VOLCADRAFT_59473 [Volvox carteri f. nagariensis]|uniref:Hydroxymethylglutaryl-CoA synthase n=1 Tax=Volvox carteri f. nagariensis TaxID=3068 RepID=D8TSV1_VOLCA|nr:uncharacterized protein VOLCADRAFT_59473 [Volvox carteri f. nagariensis]EFJ49546.1 hypothetical protein VOLCADRAFT_59473 [Volvox carteri f. nagariensis]|eukprot:XP_002949527.1 hypothetical protein VOLCADRAFT_59473 [Volvox carteri f. nagariensis]